MNWLRFAPGLKNFFFQPWLTYMCNLEAIHYGRELQPGAEFNLIHIYPDSQSEFLSLLTTQLEISLKMSKPLLELALN